MSNKSELRKFFVVYDKDPSDMQQVESVLSQNDCEVVGCRRKSRGKYKNGYSHADYSGLIILGSDYYRNVEPEKNWIKESLQNFVPVLGICHRAQLLAESLFQKVVYGYNGL